MTVSECNVIQVFFTTVTTLLAVCVEFSQPIFSVFENESEITIKLDVSRPALATFTVIVSATPDTADGKWEVFDYYNSLFKLSQILILLLVTQV